MSIHILLIADALFLVELPIRPVGEQHGVHHLVEAVCDAVAVAFAYLVNGEVGGDDGGQTVLIAVVEQFADGRYVRAEDVDIDGFNAEIVDGEQRAFLDFVKLRVLELVHLVEFHAFEPFESDVHATVLYVLGGEQIADGVHEGRFATPDIAVEQKPRFVLVAEPSADFRQPAVEVLINHKFEAERFNLDLQGETEFLRGLLGRRVFGLKRLGSVGLPQRKF